MDIDKLGRYDIVRVLGKGAMGVVYEGRDPYLDRQVAIKTIRVQSVTPEAAAEFSGRFRTEARSAARLQHPHIVSVFDSGQDGETSYLVMEFIQGDDLKQHLERGAHFTARASIKMVYDLLMALDHAHRQNVVHRDVKPANILIEANGNIKLADFGVARIQEPDEGNLTQLGAASVGTPRYMSPEQAQGIRVDARSDVFSAAVVLYELLTGKRPFDGENQFIVVNQIVSQPHPTASKVNPALPQAIDAVLDKALAKLPGDRYATARDFALALRTVALQLPESADETATSFALGPDSNPSGSSGSRNTLADAGRSLGGAGTVPGTNLTGSMTDATLAIKVNQEIELEYWKDIKDSIEPEDFVGFIGRFPNGIYADRARRRLQKLNAPGSAGSAIDGSTGSTNMGAVYDPTISVPPPAPAVAAPAPQAPPLQPPMPAQARAPVGSVPVPGAAPAPAAAPSAAAIPAAAAVAATVPAPKATSGGPAVPQVPVPARPERKPELPVPAPGPSRKGLYAAMAALVLVGALALVWMTGSDESASVPVAVLPSAAVPASAASDAASQALPAQPPASAAQEPASASAVAASASASALAGAASASVSMAAASIARPASAASAPAARASARAPQRTASARADTATPLATAPANSASSRPEAAGSAAGSRAEAPGASAPVQRGAAPEGGQGPSAAGQACADRVFVFRVACVAQQCPTDRYRNTEECVLFREAAKRREGFGPNN